MTFASASTSQLVSTEMLAGMAGVQMTNVPYKSGPAAMTDLIGGQVMMFTADFAVMLPQVKGGKIRGLAVTSTKRSPAIPELPTVNEALGLKDYELIAYFAVYRAGRNAARHRRQAQPGGECGGAEQGHPGEIHRHRIHGGAGNAGSAGAARQG